MISKKIIFTSLKWTWPISSFLQLHLKNNSYTFFHQNKFVSPVKNDLNFVCVNYPSSFIITLIPLLIISCTLIFEVQAYSHKAKSSSTIS